MLVIFLFMVEGDVVCLWVWDSIGMLVYWCVNLVIDWVNFFSIGINIWLCLALSINVWDKLLMFFEV